MVNSRMASRMEPKLQLSNDISKNTDHTNSKHSCFWIYMYHILLLEVKIKDNIPIKDIEPLYIKFWNADTNTGGRVLH